jgi:myosin heavy subunit
MQTYLPLIQAMLSEWYLFTLNNPLYAAALAITVWLLTSILYSIRIGSLKRAKTVSEKAGAESTNALQKQLQESQEELTATTLQMEKAASAAQEETQRALSLEQLIYQRNKQIADMIQMLATSFDLGERPLLATEDVKADLLWQQHTKVVTQLVERLRTEQQAKKELQQTYQAETAKLAEKEVQLETLQSTLDNHTTLLSNLERVLEEQKTILQQQNNSQQALSDTLKNFQLPVAVAPIAVVPPAEPIKETIKPYVHFEAKSYAVDTPLTQTPPSQTFQSPKTVDQKTPFEVVNTLEAEAHVKVDIKPKSAFEEAPYASLDTEQQPVIPAKGSMGIIKNLFAKKQPPAKTEPQWTDTKPVEPEALPLPTKTEQQPDEKEKKAPGKLQGLYSRFKPKGK